LKPFRRLHQTGRDILRRVLRKATIASAIECPPQSDDIAGVRIAAPDCTDDGEFLIGWVEHADLHKKTAPEWRTAG